MKNIYKTAEQIKREYEQHKAYRERNKERLQKRQKDLSIKNKEHLSEVRKKRREKNYEKYIGIERKYRQNNRPRINELMNKRRREMRQRCLKYLGGAVCCLCGFSSKYGSQFDLHHCKDKKIFAISKAISQSWLWEIIQPELKKCVVLCRNCHGLIGSSEWEQDEFPIEIKNKIINLGLNNS